MGIGFVIFFWVLFTSATIVVYLTLWLLSKRFVYADVLRNGFNRFAVVVFFVMTCGTVYGLANFYLQNTFPSLIFSKQFKFSPTDDVKNLNGSVKMFGSGGIGETLLNFKAEKTTVDKIVENRGFIEKFRESYRNADDLKFRELAKISTTKTFVSFDFYENCDAEMSTCTAFLAYNEADGEVYFVW
jgi:hypothetical protein